MAKIRVHELAKELNIPSKEMVVKLQEMGVDVRNHMSTLEPNQADWVRRRFGTQPEQQKKDAPQIKTARGSDEKGSAEPRRGSGHQAERRPQREPGQEAARPAQPGSTDRTSERRDVDRGQDAARRDISPEAKRGQDVRGQENRPPRPGVPDGQRHADPRGSEIRPQKTPAGEGPRPGDARGFEGRRPEGGQRDQAGGDRRQGFTGRGDRPHRPEGKPPEGREARPQTPGGPEQRKGEPRPHQGAPSRPFSPDQRRGDFRPQGQGAPRPQPGAPRPQGGPSRPQGGGPRPQGGPRPGAPAPNKGKPGPAAGDKPRKQGPPSKGRDYHRPEVEKSSDRDIQKILGGKFGRSKSKKKGRQQEGTTVTPEVITILDKISVRDLAEMLGKPPAELVKKLFNLGIMTTVNQDIDYDVAEILASDYDVKVLRGQTDEEKLLEPIIDDEASLKARPPIVTVMGHVDHGKTSLLDAIRKTNVVAGEAGGITQHIGAYQVEVNGSRITFIDTPGHEAFTAMRYRGAQATDIAVLVVAADDGVMPQTIEAINHARAAEVPIVVALNKIDKPDANPDRVKQQLAEHGLVPEDWGGDTICVPVSAKTKLGIENLLEMILLVAEMREIKANPDRPAEGIVLEGQLDKGRGPVASVLVQKGTLRVGDTMVVGSTWGKVRAMTDDKGRRVSEARPAAPVEVQGLNEVPMAGDVFVVVDEKVAKQVAEMRQGDRKREEQAQTSRVSLDDFFRQMKEADIKELNIIIKGDVQGSVEALGQSLERLSTPEVKVNVIHSGVGAVTESDVMLASTSNAIIIGFNVRPDSKARKFAETEGIDVRLYRVIYEAIDDVKKAMAGLLEPEHREVFLGRLEVRATFKVPKIGTVAGGYVIEGKVTRQANIRVLREGVVVFEGKVASLKRFKEDVREVVGGYECGIGVEGFNDIKEGDIIEAYTIEDVPREL